MEVNLVVAGGKAPGRVVPVTGPKFFIGRAPDCDLVIMNRLVSRYHCTIVVGENFVALQAFGNKTGTSVNHGIVRGQRELKTGDRLTVGPVEFEVRVAPDAGVRKKPRLANVATEALRHFLRGDRRSSHKRPRSASSGIVIQGSKDGSTGLPCQ